MKQRAMLVALAGTIVLASTALLFGGKTATPPADKTLWPTKGWATANPGSVGLDEQVLLRLDRNMASGRRISAARTPEGSSHDPQMGSPLGEH